MPLGTKLHSPVWKECGICVLTSSSQSPPQWLPSARVGLQEFSCQQRQGAFLALEKRGSKRGRPTGPTSAKRPIRLSVLPTLFPSCLEMLQSSTPRCSELSKYGHLWKPREKEPKVLLHWAPLARLSHRGPGQGGVSGASGKFFPPLPGACFPTPSCGWSSPSLSAAAVSPLRSLP